MVFKIKQKLWLNEFHGIRFMSYVWGIWSLTTLLPLIQYCAILFSPSLIQSFYYNTNFSKIKKPFLDMLGSVIIDCINQWYFALWLANVFPALLLVLLLVDLLANFLAALPTLPPWCTAISQYLLCKISLQKKVFFGIISLREK